MDRLGGFRLCRRLLDTEETLSPFLSAEAMAGRGAARLRIWAELTASWVLSQGSSEHDLVCSSPSLTLCRCSGVKFQLCGQVDGRKGSRFQAEQGSSLGARSLSLWPGSRR